MVLFFAIVFQNQKRPSVVCLIITSQPAGSETLVILKTVIVLNIKINNIGAEKVKGLTHLKTCAICARENKQVYLHLFMVGYIDSPEA